MGEAIFASCTPKKLPMRSLGAPFYFAPFLAFLDPHEIILALTAPRSAGFGKAARVKRTNNMTLTGLGFTFVIFKGWRQ